jgi:hypothetical protein
MRLEDFWKFLTGISIPEILETRKSHKHFLPPSDMFSGNDLGSHVFNGMPFLNTATKSTPRYQNSQWRGDFTPSPLGSLGSPLPESLDLFNDTAAMQRVTQPPCNPFQQVSTCLLISYLLSGRIYLQKSATPIIA